jgi:2-iminobutanoate/2-iminopropanoate deaminase
VSVRDITELIGTVQGVPEALGLRVDDLVYGCGVTGRDRHSGDYEPDLLRQADHALDTVDAQLRDLGGSLDDVARISFFLRDPGDIRKVNDVWTARFPDAKNRPTYKFMRAPLNGPEEVRLDYFAVLGAERESLYLPKVAHANPIPMAVKIGRYLFTSRVLPYDPATGDAGRDGAEQAGFAVLNAGTLLERAGMSWPDVTQGRAFVAEPDLDELMRAEWHKRFEATAAAPLQVTRYRAGALSALLEIIAVH